MRNPNKLKRAVIKEELVALTGDYISAVILQQLLYWGERVGDVDEFLEEENKRRSETEKLPLMHGWIYKDSKELAEETMLALAPSTMRRYLVKLVERGLISERENPTDKWDHTLQYRPDLRTISEALAKLGYPLDGYSNLRFETSSFQNENPGFQNENPQDAKSPYFVEGNSQFLPPEITTEITNISPAPNAVPHSPPTIDPDFAALESASGNEVSLAQRPTRDAASAVESLKQTLSNPALGQGMATADPRIGERLEKEALAGAIAFACGFATPNKDCYAALKQMQKDMPCYQGGARVPVTDIVNYLLERGAGEKKLGSPYYCAADTRTYFAKRKPDGTNGLMSPSEQASPRTVNMNSQERAAFEEMPYAFDMRRK